MTAYRKRVYSGICLCGHREDQHWRGLIARKEAYEIMGPYLHGACLALGCNEFEGMDAKTGEGHCYNYVDKEDPDPEVLASWRGTTK